MTGTARQRKTTELNVHKLVLPDCPGGQRLDLALAAALPQFSRSRLATWVKEGAVTVDGASARPRDAVYGGETVVVRAQALPTTEVQAESIALQVVLRDPHFHPGAGNRAHTLQNGLLALDPKLAAIPRAGIVHRIDKDTSGLLVVARTLEAHKVFTDALREHQVQREYIALCVGALTGGGTIDKPIGRHRTDRLRMTVRADGRDAVTHYRLDERFAGHSLLQLTAGTKEEQRKVLKGFKRQALHAARLVFAHPVTGKQVTVQSKLPDDFAALLAGLRDQ
jgi:23S rRNA pseudouridine1911/1915/1917 synthase